jgi:hypothetical protein
MAHGRDKQGREKRKPKKEKVATAAKPRADAEVIQHVQGHPQPSTERRSDS